MNICHTPRDVVLLGDFINLPSADANYYSSGSSSCRFSDKFMDFRVKDLRH